MKKLSNLQESGLRKIVKLLKEEENSSMATTLASHAKWDAELITKIYLDALTDANAHTERRRLVPVLNKLFRTSFDDADY